jgi:hypothetical protein
MKQFIQGMKFSCFFLLACGAVVRERDALVGLKSITEEYVFFDGSYLQTDCSHSLKFTDAFAFGARQLFAHHPAIWMMSYADQVIISGQPSGAAISGLLYSSPLGKHTSVTYLNRATGGEAVVQQYIWEHQSQRPNTHSFPIACPICNHIYSWQNIPKTRPDGSAITIKCKTRFLNNEICKGSWDIPARTTSSVVEAPYVGVWRMV